MKVKKFHALIRNSVIEEEVPLRLLHLLLPRSYLYPNYISILFHAP